MGLIAQEVKKIIPEVVSGKEGYIEKVEILGIQYGNLLPAPINAIKELQGLITELKTENGNLESAVT